MNTLQVMIGTLVSGGIQMSHIGFNSAISCVCVATSAPDPGMDSTVYNAQANVSTNHAGQL